jgi:hypothetical protein
VQLTKWTRTRCGAGSKETLTMMTTSDPEMKEDAQCLTIS